MKNLYPYVFFLFISLQVFGQTSDFVKIPVANVSSEEKGLSLQGLLAKKIPSQSASGLEFKLIDTKTDKLGFTHKTYQQYYNGIKVLHGIVKVHNKNGLKESYNGMYFNAAKTGFSRSGTFSTSRLKSIATQFMGSTDINWLDDEGISKSNEPITELIIFPNRRTETLHLAYAVGVSVSKPELKIGTLYIDAKTGEVLSYKNQLFLCFESKEAADHSNHKHNHSEDHKTNFSFTTGTGATVYSGSRTIETTLDNGNYILHDQTRATTGIAHDYGQGAKSGIMTVNQNNDDSTANYNNPGIITDFTDNDNNWTAGEMSANEDQYALDAHWGSQVVYDYWKNEQSRDSYNGSDASIVSYMHFGTNFSNAGWAAFNSNRGFMIYGDGGGSWTPLSNLDIVGHEIGHGVTNSNSNLDYELESGALNEGFSDIWAMVIENYSNNTYGTSKDIGEINEENGQGAIRSMRNPNLYNQPDTYRGNHWINTLTCTPASNNDYCGVHTNSGVLNYWFWLLSQGGSGTNDNGDSYNITGIGIEKAAAIAYRAESVYLTNTSNFNDTRNAAIQAAKDLYGAYCSTEEEVVTNAFYAVGVGSTFLPTMPVVHTDISNVRACELEVVQLTTSATDAESNQWQVNTGSGWNTISEGGFYSGVTSDVLTMTLDASLHDYQFRNQYTNGCGTVVSSVSVIDVELLPVVTNVTTTVAGCSSPNDGTLSITFPDSPTRNVLEISIDGGNNFPYRWNDNIGIEDITGLTAGSYTIWVRWGDDDCPIEVGTYVIDATETPTAIITGTIEASVGQSDGVLQVSIGDNPTQSQIKFSIDNGATYPYTFDDTIGTTEITGLPGGDYDIWIINGDNTCPSFVGTVTIAAIAYTSIPDDNFEQRLEELGYDNNHLDDRVPTSLISSITSLIVRVENISDLSGIEDFTALEELFCDNNNLTTLDVSNNTALTRISAYRNNITTIDVSQNVNLEILDLSNNSIAGNLDISNLTALKTVGLYNNALTGLTGVSDATAIEILLLYGNNITGEYDFSNHTAMNRLEIHGNNISGTLDLSNAPNLNRVKINNNDFSVVNIRNGNNVSMAELDARNNSQLTCISVDDAAYSNANASWRVNGNSYFSNTDCRYTAIPDPNFEAALEALGYDDVSGDGQVPTELIEEVTDLNVSNQNITDLTGIEAFAALVVFQTNNNTLGTLNLSQNTNLVQLNANNCSLTSLDVTNNVALKYLYCFNNPLATIDLSNNAALEVINMENNALTALDVSSNTALKVIRVKNNNLTVLDLSNNSALTRLECWDNNLNTLNVRNGNNSNVTLFSAVNNPSLTCIYVDDTTYSTTNWTNIDAHTSFVEGDYCRYTAIPDANFEDYLESQGYDDISGDGQVPTALIEVVTNMGMSNEGVSDMTGIEDFTALEELYAQNNDFATIDLSNNLNLELINVSFNSNLTTLDLSNNTALIGILVDGTNLTSLALSNLINLQVLFANTTSITSLDLSQNAALTVVQTTNNPNLTSIDVRNGNNTNIAALNITNNPRLFCVNVSDLAHMSTVATLDPQTNLTASDCPYTAIPDANFEAALDALGYDDISGDGQVPTGSIQGITNLDISNQNINDLTGIEDFAALQILDIHYNNISDLDLSNNTVIEELYAYTAVNNSFNVSNMSALRVLHCYEAGFTSLNLTNATALEELHVYHSDLTTLDISTNTVLRVVQAYEHGLSSINTNGAIALEELYVYSSTIPSLDVSSNTTLTTLHAYQSGVTNINVSGLVNLSSLLCYSNGITSLDLSSNIGLTEVQCHDNDLTFLDMRNGNNTNITTFSANQNNNLTCVSVDDATYSATNWTAIDPYTNFSNFDCRYTAIPDANFEAALEALGYDDISGDGQVPTVLIEGVTSLDVKSLGIVDLTGIEDFTALSILNCMTNDLGTINVSNNLNLTELLVNNCSLNGELDLSANTQLTKLFAYSNFLTTVNVNNSASLNHLSLYGNQLTSLNVSNNIALKKLNVFGNKITELDLSNNVVLTEISCYKNELTSLNVKNGNNTNVTIFKAGNNPLLTCVNVDDAVYSTTNWTDIGVQTSFSDTYCRYTAIPDANFEAALETLGYDDISGDGQVPTVLIEVITDLNISYTNNISDVTGIEDFTSLQTLDLSGQNITTIDLFQNLLLESFTSNNAALTALDLSNNILLEILSCQANDIGNLNISNNHALTSLNAGSNSFATIDLSGNPNLEQLVLSGNSITSIDLSNNTLLDMFFIIDTPISELDLSNNINLTYLDLKDTEVQTIDLSNLPILDEVYLNSNDNMTYANVANGNNGTISTFRIIDSPNLTCVKVDDVAYSTTNWTNVGDYANFIATDYCRYTAIPDANFEAALETLGYDDISADGQVPTALIEVITNLDVSNQGIADFTGIEDFTNLELISCTNNNLTSLDFSNNLALESIRCQDNSITSIDVSSNTQLRYLGADTNNIASIDVSNCTVLEYVNLENNPLISIDLSNNVLLEAVNFQNTLLVTLDLSANLVIDTIEVAASPNLEYINLKNGNNTTILDDDFLINECPNLTCVSVDDVAFSVANWTAYVDVHTNFTETNYCRYTSIPDANFEAALEVLGYDDITADGQVPTALIEIVDYLDVDGENISELTGIEDFTALLYLYAGNNQLTSIDVSNNILLDEIDVTNNQLTTIDLSANTAATIVSLDSNLLTAIDVSANTNLIYLGLGSNPLATVDVTTNTLLEGLKLDNIGLTTIDISNNTLLDNLNITNNLLTSLDIGANTQLERLDVRDNNLTSLDTSTNTLLENLFCPNNQITSLDLSTNVNISRFTAFNNNLSELNVQNGANGQIIQFFIAQNDDLTCVLVDDAGYSTINWTNIDGQTSFSETGCNTGIQLAATVFLQGAALNPNIGEESLMRDDIRVAAILPTTSPYADSVSCASSVFDVTGSDAIVDWIWVELRDATDNTIVIDSQSALLQRDGNIVNVDGVSELNFEQAEGDYYLVIKHRNHLGIMSENTVTLSVTATEIDFSSDSTLTLGGTNAIVDLGTGVFAMLSGDYDENGQIQNSDINNVITVLGSSGYDKADMDMNGQIQNTDINNILNPNVGKGEQF